MDPNTALKEIREFVIGQHYKNLGPDEVDRLCEVFDGLDEWLSKGGFLPEDWKGAVGERHWQDVLSSTNDRAYKRGYEDGRFDRKVQE